MDGLIISAVKMDDDTIIKIEDKFSLKLGETIKLHMEVDPSLMCGFIVTINHHRYDYSARTKLLEMKKYLLKD